MARVAHATSAAWHRNQIAAISRPKTLDRSLRKEFNGSSRASTPDACLAWRLARATTRASFHDRRNGHGTCAYWTSLAQRVLVDFAILHDDDKILVGICDEVDVVEGIAIHQQQICKCAGFHDAEL